MRRAASILASRDKWRPADVPLQAVGVASLANLFIGLWSDVTAGEFPGKSPMHARGLAEVTFSHGLKL